MNPSDQPEAKLPKNYQVGSMLVSRRPDEVGITIFEDEFQTLCEGETSEAKGKRDFNRGLCCGALVALVGLLASTDWGTFSERKHVWPFWFCCLIFVVAIAVFGMGWFKDEQRLAQVCGNSAYSRLRTRLSARFEVIARESITEPGAEKG